MWDTGFCVRREAVSIQASSTHHTLLLEQQQLVGHEASDSLYLRREAVRIEASHCVRAHAPSASRFSPFLTLCCLLCVCNYNVIYNAPLLALLKHVW